MSVESRLSVSNVESTNCPSVLRSLYSIIIEKGVKPFLLSLATDSSQSRKKTLNSKRLRGQRETTLFLSQENMFTEKMSMKSHNRLRLGWTKHKNVIFSNLQIAKFCMWNTVLYFIKTKHTNQRMKLFMAITAI